MFRFRILKGRGSRCHLSIEQYRVDHSSWYWCEKIPVGASRYLQLVSHFGKRVMCWKWERLVWRKNEPKWKLKMWCLTSDLWHRAAAVWGRAGRGNLIYTNWNKNWPTHVKIILCFDIFLLKFLTLNSENGHRGMCRLCLWPITVCCEQFYGWLFLKTCVIYV